MARGRFISNKIIFDRQINELSNDTCRLAYTWAITLADKEGRIIGEPEILLAQLFPRRRDITVEDIQSFINEWVSAGFIFIYLGRDGDKVIRFKNFEKNQVGLRKDKEPESSFDDPSACRIIAGKVTDKIPSNVIECNLNEIEDKGENSAASIPKDEKEPQTQPTPYLRIFSQVTGMVGIPGNDPKVYESLDNLMSVHQSEDKVIEYLKPYWEAWGKLKSKNGRPYSKTNLAWLTEYALACEIPGDGNEGLKYKGSKYYDE